MPEATPREKELSEQLARATGELAGARIEIKLLREKIDALVRRIALPHGKMTPEAGALMDAWMA